MKVTVCNTITYYYDVELPEWMCEKDEDGDLVHEQLFLDACYEADQNALTDATEWESDINSVWTKDGKKELYCS